MGEAVRIGYRGQTLNSKGGYISSGLSRLVLEERIEEIREEKDSSGMEESYQEPKGLGRLDRVWTGEKRKENQHKDSQPQSKKRRKLKFPTLSEDWGLEGDLQRMEDEESRKKAFLQEGMSDMISGKTSLQLTIRKWSANEIYFHKISQEIIGKSADKGAFHVQPAGRNQSAQFKTSQ